MDATNVTNAASAETQAIIAAPAQDEPYRFGRRPITRAPVPGKAAAAFVMATHVALGQLLIRAESSG